jgi:hypothetical protein
MKPSGLDLIENFDKLPDDAVVQTRIGSLVLGLSEWTVRRQYSDQLIHLSARRRGLRVGFIRSIARGEITAT